jgi:hypothetical protein
MRLLHFTWTAIFCCKAAKSHDATKNTTIQEEIHMFLAQNGFKYVTLVENSTTPSEAKSKMTWTIAKGGASYMRSFTMNEYREKTEKNTFKFLDLHVFIMDVENDEVDTFLHAMTQAPVKSSVIGIKSLWRDFEEADFKNTLDNFKLNSLFYLAVTSEQSVKWYQVITITSGYAMTELQFSRGTFKIIEDYDLNWLTIYSISISRSPYLTFEDCDKSGKHCKHYGYLKDYTDVIAQKLNFTYESHGDIDGDWGTLPKSGPYNHSAWCLGWCNGWGNHIRV